MSKKSLNGSDFEEVYGNDLITSNQADKKKIAQSVIEGQATNEETKLIRHLNSLGINVFEYTDMSHHNRHSNIKIRDVIQIYRIFNNLRDSGDDRHDEIKLSKLSYFPFFDHEDYNQLKMTILSKSDGYVNQSF